MTKNVGVPFTPLRIPLRKSSRNLPAWAWLSQVGDELLEVEAERGCVSHQVSRPEAILVREEEVVHLPEPALRAGRLSRLGGLVRVRVDLESGKWR